MVGMGISAYKRQILEALTTTTTLVPFYDSGRTIAVLLKVAKRRYLSKVISIVNGCEQYLVARFNREIVWQLDSKADSIAATLLSLCS